MILSSEVKINTITMNPNSPEEEDLLEARIKKKEIMSNLLLMNPMKIQLEKEGKAKEGEEDQKERKIRRKFFMTIFRMNLTFILFSKIFFKVSL
jgi:hypothetical protein